MPEQSPLMTDFPKLDCPFIRKTFRVDEDDYKKNGRKMQLREPAAYLVVNEINPGYEWVFEDPETIAVEKLHGTNVKLKTEKGRLIALQNRKNVIDPLQIVGGQSAIVEGVLMSAFKDLVERDGEQAGEVIGPKLQNNPYKLPHHLWYPFQKSITSLRYKSFDKFDRNFDNWSSWFKEHLFSLFYCAYHKIPHKDCDVMAEGVIFYNLKRKAEYKTWMAKLRRDMYPWYYEGQVRIYEEIPNRVIEES